MAAIQYVVPGYHCETQAIAQSKIRLQSEKECENCSPFLPALYMLPLTKIAPFSNLTHAPSDVSRSEEVKQYMHMGSAENPFPVLHIAKAKEKSSVIDSQSGGVPPLRIQATSGVYRIML